MRTSILLAFCCIAAIFPQHLALADATTRPAPQMVDLPGNPFAVTASRDGNWVFVTVFAGGDQGGGVAVIQRQGNGYQLRRVIPLKSDTIALCLTHDESRLIAASGDSVFVLDTSRVISGSGDPVLGTFVGGRGNIYANVTADDKLLFVSEERGGVITVVDLDRAKSNGYDPKSIVGQIPVGAAPIALTFSPDGRWLYNTCEGASPQWGWADKADQGAVLMIDVAKASTDPSNAVVARVPAGQSPVRMTISADGKFIFVTAREENDVLMFDTAKLVMDPDHARLATVKVGPAPVPIALIQGGRTLVVGNSNRFSRLDADKPQTLSVLDVAKMSQGDAVIGTIPAGAFPRAMCVSVDGKTLFVSNFRSDSLEIIDAHNPPIDSN